MKSFVAPLVLSLLVICLTSGCENKQVKEMTGTGPKVVYPELDAFENEHLMGVGYAASGPQPNWGEVRRLASADAFKAGISQLEAAAPPSGVSTEKKQAIIDAAKKLSEAGANDAEAAYKSLLEAISAARN